MIKQFYKEFAGSYIQTFDDTKQSNSGLVKSFPMSELSQRKQ